MRFKKFMLMVKLSIATFMILGVFVGGGMYAFVSMTDKTFDGMVNPDTGDGSFSLGGESEAQTSSSMSNDYPPPKEEVDSKKIDGEKYEWESLKDPGDPGQSHIMTSEGRFDSEDLEYYIFEKVNNIRREHGLDEFQKSKYLASVSRAHSADMAQREYFSHENPDGEHIWHRFRDNKQGQSCEVIGENIAKNWANLNVEREGGPGTTVFTNEEDLAEGIVRQWMNSRGHREAILNGNYDVMGLGVYVDESYRFEHREDVIAAHSTQGFCDLHRSGN